jgi:tRNA(fMet)-specific endonuclease VapC
MPVRYLLDTNICIYIRRQHPPKLLARFEEMEPGEAAISIVTYGDLHFGTQKSANADRARKDLENLLTTLPVLALPIEAAPAYGKIRAALERRGEIIGANDLWIAAHALSVGLTLVTNNEREFTRIEELSVENWAS